MQILRFSSRSNVERNMGSCKPVGPACNCNSQCRSIKDPIRCKDITSDNIAVVNLCDCEASLTHETV